MGAFAVYEKCEIGDRQVSLQDVCKLFKKSLSRYYDDYNISLTGQGFTVSGNLKSVWERAITKANAQLKIEGNILSYRVEGTASLGAWPWLWFFLGFFTGFFFLWFFFDLVEYIICRDRPKKYFEEAFTAVAFELGCLPKLSLDNNHRRDAAHRGANPPAKACNAVVEQIYILRNGQQFGPYSFEQMKVDVVLGHFQANELAWYQGAPTWVPLSQVPGITFPPRPPAAIG